MLNVVIRPFNRSCSLALLLGMAAVPILPSQAQVSPASQLPAQLTAQELESGQQSENSEPGESGEDRSLSLAGSILSLEGGQRLMAEAGEAINTEKYDLAADKLQQARKIFNQLSNFHLQLASSFSGIDPKIAETERNSALKTSQIRDEATYQLALVHRAQNKPELAVPLLIQIIRSQNPTSDLGKKSYQQLYEIGFVEAPYTATSPLAPPTTAPINPSPNQN